jgi:phosphonate degradation associated HDIG domain protein
MIKPTVGRRHRHPIVVRSDHDRHFPQADDNQEQAMQTVEQKVDQVFSGYVQRGSDDYIGEPVSQIEHMSQAAQQAIDEGYDDEVVLAAFFHDIGHLCGQGPELASMGDYGVMSHERVGADYLRAFGFSERVAQLVEYHVQAKRYLTLRQPGYYAQLSEASRQTLEYQGGVMSEAEADAFEQDPLCAISLRMRQWDERAKEMNVPVMDLRVLKEMAVTVLRR